MSSRHLVHLLAILLVGAPLLTSSAHVVLDDHCDHHLPVELPTEAPSPFAPGDDECAFLAYLLHAVPLVTEASVPVPEAGEQAWIVPPPPVRCEVARSASDRTSRAPPSGTVA